jgi:hypothetical protein
VTTESPDSQLIQGLEMTRQMLELVKAGEWEAVAKLGSDRLQLLRQWEHQADPNTAQACIGILQEIQALDQEIERLGREGRDEAAKQLRQIHQGRKADKAYRS